MKKLFGSMVIFIFASILLPGCGGGGSSSVTPTTTVRMSGGTARITAVSNADANIVVNDFNSSGWGILLPVDTLATDTTFEFADIVPGSGGVPSIPANRIFGVSLWITATPSISSGKTVTILNDAGANSDLETGDTVDLMKVISGDWTVIGTATKYYDGTLRADVSGFSMLSLGVRDATGTYDETFTITSSTDPYYCGSSGSIDYGNNVIAQNGVVMTFNPNDPNCVTTASMKAHGAFSGATSCIDMSLGCTVNTVSTFTGTLDISLSPKEYSGTVSSTSTFGSSCASAPPSCTITGMVTGVLRN